MFDIIVLGGGIGGLYSAYSVLKKHPRASVLVLEKESYLGGRVYTYHDKFMTVEAGAGRFHKNHLLLMKLIREMGLGDRVIKITNDSSFVPTGVVTKLPTYNMDSLIKRVMVAGKKADREVLKQVVFIDFIGTVLDESETKYVQNAFGYYSELVIMNAYNALHLMDELMGPGNDFYVLGGGLSQLVDELVRHIGRLGGKIYMKKNVLGVVVEEDGLVYVECQENKRPFVGKSCICALPKQVAEQFRFFASVRPYFKSIKCAPLCRIYCKFSDVWFRGLGKITTNNALRMIIPISEENGIIMISYSDYKYALWWNRLYKEDGVSGVNRELRRLVQLTLGKDIGVPLSTRVCFWDCGVGYWGVGANSEVDMSRPIAGAPVYLCGEHYSSRFQQWMEGALETAAKVVKQIVI
jgi:monoamine oxidase